jgi:hypothetical protein
MIVYNVTLSIHPAIEEEAITWLKEEHIPEVMATGLFVSSNMFKVLEHPQGKTHNSYAVQYTLESWLKFSEYEKKYAEIMRTKTKEKYGENILAFRTFLEAI